MVTRLWLVSDPLGRHRATGWPDADRRSFSVRR